MHAGLPCIAALYLLAAVLAGFAFHPGHAAPAITMLALPDGTVPSLCLSDPAAPGNPGPGDAGQGDAGKVTRSHSCDFCRLADAPGMLPEALGVLHSISFLLVASLLLAGPVFKPRAVFRARTRAPPVALA